MRRTVALYLCSWLVAIVFATAAGLIVGNCVVMMSWGR